MRWFETPDFDFIKAHRIAYVVSGIMLVLAIIGIFAEGLEYGIDFKGGKEFTLEFEQPVEVATVRDVVSDSLESTPVVKEFGSPRDILIRTDDERDITKVQHSLLGAVGQHYAQNKAKVIKTNIVGARFAEDLKAGALNAIIFALIVVFIYILIRFKNWRYSAGAVTALFHDVIIVLGVFVYFSKISPFSMQIDQSIIAAFLTIVGYSLNDTVVVFDRIRENNLLYKTMDFEEIVNKSLNDTLSRTVITSLTTFFVVTILFVFGGQVLKGFSFALMLGVVIGTYSSMFIASSMVVELEAGEEKS